MVGKRTPIVMYSISMRWQLFLVLAVGLPVCAQVKITQGTDRITIDVDGKPFTALYNAGQAPKPYLHPLRSASGKIVTRHYPMELMEGEERDHPHHRGLWFTHGAVNGYDFWANEPSQKGDKKGRVDLKKPVDLKSGKTGTIKATYEWIDGAGKRLLTEDRSMVFYSDPAERVMDFDIKLTAIDKSVFGDTKEGTFAIRLATSMDEKHGGHMTSSDGKHTEKEIWGSRSAWVDYVGMVQGEKIGITIMDHPSSTRYPTYWHARAYGLFAANAFGLHDFLRDKTKDGSLTLEPGQSAHFRYRVVIHPGDTESAKIAEHYKKFAAMK